MPMAAPQTAPASLLCFCWCHCITQDACATLLKGDTIASVPAIADVAAVECPAPMLVAAPVWMLQHVLYTCKLLAASRWVLAGVLSLQALLILRMQACCA